MKRKTMKGNIGAGAQRCVATAALCLGLTAGNSAGAEYWIFRDAASGPAEFGAQEIKQALEAKAHAVTLKSLAEASQAGGANRVYLAPANASTTALLAAQGKTVPALEPQAFALRVATGGTPSWFAVGGDETGVLYGALEIAERIRHLGPSAVAEVEQKPYLRRRGIKFNWPLDARTPSYTDPGTAGALGVATVWDMEFWKTQLDEMARSRMNCLSLWNLHPFPSIVKVAEYPTVALADVKTTFARTLKLYSGRGLDFVDADVLNNLVHVKTMSIDEKIAFWKAVMAYAKSRGIETYLFTWNMFVYGAEGKHGITESQSNATTTDYYRKSVAQTLRTYPDLAGFGITSGENLSGDKEGWLWSTYGLGVADYMKENPGRSVRMIHRQHEGSLSDITDKWGDYAGPFDMSYKYSQAHAYSSTKPQFMNSFAAGLPAGMKTFLTVRNDDFYYFRFGDPEFVRAYIKGVPQAKVEGFYYGPDGYILGRNVTSKDSVWAKRSDIEKNWLAIRLWGRLGYDPNVPAATFKSMVETRLGAPASLADIWATASKIVPLVSRYHWDALDFQWYPEGCLSHPSYKGYHALDDFRNTGKFPGDDPGSAATVAAELKMLAKAALDGSKDWRRQGKAELRSTLGDIEAQGHLGNYYAEKILGAAATGSVAINHMNAAAGHARLYAQSALAQYTGQWLNRIGRFDFGTFVTNAYGDIKLAGGSGLLPSATARTGGTLLEAEAATLKGGTTAAGTAGFTGTGYVDFASGQAQSAEWAFTAPQAGRYSLEARYSLPTGEMPMELRINGVVAGELAMVPTGSNGTWLLEGIEVDLAAGKNVITITAIKDAPWLDHVNVLYLGPTAIGIPAAGPMASLFLRSGYVHLELPGAARVTLDLLDHRGRRVVRILDEVRGAGTHGFPLRMEIQAQGRYYLEARVGDRRFLKPLAHIR